MLPLALVLLAILLGGAGLYLGLTTKQQLAPLTKSADEGTTLLLALISNFLRSIHGSMSCPRRIPNLKKPFSALVVKVRRHYGRPSKRMKVSNPIVARLIELAQKVSQFATSVAVTNASSSRLEATSTGIETSAIETFPASGSASTYKIQSGDTFGKIAIKKA